MDTDNNIRSGNLGLLVGMAVAPIVFYIVALLVLGWIAAGYR
jgi:hypothetical protein